MQSLATLSRLALLSAIIGFLANGRAAAQTPKKLPIPSEEAANKAADLVQELYREELERAAKEPEFLSSLAARFLEEGRETRDYPAGRYILLVQARLLASRAGDGPTALAAIEELSRSFDVDPAVALRLKIETLGKASAAATTPAAYQTLVDLSLSLLEEALAADDYASAKQLATAAEAAARKLRNVPLVSAVRKRQDEVERLEKEFARWKPFADKLAKTPDDPKANLEIGKYQAFVKGDWERGLPHLAKGENDFLRNLAKKDLAEPRKGLEQLAVAEGWLEASSTLEGDMKNEALLRGYQWFLQALGDLEGAQRKAVEAKLDHIVKSLPPEYQFGEITGELRKGDGNFGPMYGIAFSPDGKSVAACGADGGIHVFDVRTGKHQRRLDGHAGRAWTVAFAPDNRRIASGGFDSSIRLWDLTSGREIRKLTGHTDYVRSLTFNRDGRLILSGGDDRMVRLHSDTGSEVRSFPGHEHFVWSVALSRDGRKALSASLDKTVRLWDVQSGALLKTLKGHGDTVLSVAFSPDGRRAISASTDKTLKVWDLQTGEAIQTLKGHKGYVHSVAVSPDGRRALSASQDRTIRLWDLVTGAEIRVLEGHTDQVWSVAFSQDGRYAASAGQDGTVRIWGSVK